MGTIVATVLSPQSASSIETVVLPVGALAELALALWLLIRGANTTAQEVVAQLGST